jgi:hypothetical protein
LKNVVPGLFCLLFPCPLIPPSYHLTLTRLTRLLQLFDLARVYLNRVHL